jgi:hypothetical protein
MLKNIIIGLLLLTSGLLAWQFMAQQQKAETREKLLYYYLDYNHKEILHFVEEIETEIYEEVNFEGKTINEGLKDTIRFILKKHGQLILSENLAFEEALEYEKELREIWDKLLFQTLGEWTFGETNMNVNLDSRNLKVRLMELERDVLSLINGRLGVGGWAPAFYSPFFYPEDQDTIYLSQADTMRLWVGISLGEIGDVFEVDFKPKQPGWQVSVGWIEKKGKNRFWCFSKNDFAEKEVIEAEIYGRIERATGGFKQTETTRKIFKIVR